MGSVERSACMIMGAIVGAAFAGTPGALTGTAVGYVFGQAIRPRVTS